VFSKPKDEDFPVFESPKKIILKNKFEKLKRMVNV
jgi:hypothetical protein